MAEITVQVLFCALLLAVAGQRAVVAFWWWQGHSHWSPRPLAYPGAEL